MCHYQITDIRGWVMGDRCGDRNERIIGQEEWVEGEDD